MPIGVTVTPRLTVLISALLTVAQITGVGPLLTPAAQAQGMQPQASTPTSPLSIRVPDPPAAVPGAFVTVMYSVEGQGEYLFEMDGGPDWQPVSRSRRLTLSGRTLLPVTYRVPPLAAVGPSPALVLRATQGGREVARAEARAAVQGAAKLSLSSPRQLTGNARQPLTVPLEVSNLGNQPDTVQLEIMNAGTARLSDQSVTLQPGESRTVTATLTLERVSDNYLYVLFFKATSSVNGAVTAAARTDALFNSVTVGGAANTTGPALTFGVTTGVQGGVTFAPEGRSTFWRYSVQPTVSGALSDSVTTNGVVSGLDGTDERPLPSGLSVGLSLKSGKWGASLNAGSGGFGVSGNTTYRTWLLSGGARYQRLQNGALIGVGLGASAAVAGGKLAVDANTFLINRTDPQTQNADRQRTDSLGVSYSRTFTPNLAGNAGVQINGYQGSGPYTVGVSVGQQLEYNTQTFDVTQTYFGTLGGLQTFGVSGGLRSVQPFGVRAAATVQSQPGGLNWSTTGVLSYNAPSGYGASLSGRSGGGTLPNTPTLWQATLAGATPALRVGGAVLTGAASYTLAKINLDSTNRDTATLDSAEAGLPADQGLSHSARLNLAVAAGAFQGSGEVDWNRKPQSGSADDEQRLKFGLSGSYLWRGNTFSAKYALERLSGSLAPTGTPAPLDPTTHSQTMHSQTTHRAEAAWSRDWTPQLSSSFEYARTWGGTSPLDPNSTGGGQSLGFNVRVQDVFTPGLHLNAGYRLSGLAGAAAGPTQTVTVGLQYNLAYRVATPGALVNAFGGRKGGGVRGVLFRDSNLNGLRDTGETGLGGVTVRLGTVSAVSDAQGQYTLRVPVGRYTPTFTAGLPATLEALSAEAVDVKENSNLVSDIPFAAVANAEVLIFNDLNLNGLREDGEPPIPYASVDVGSGVVGSGVVGSAVVGSVALGGAATHSARRTVQADARGIARLSALLEGRYTASLPPSGLPDLFVPTSPALNIAVKPGERLPGLVLGAALPPRKTVTTYSAGAVAVLGSFSENDLAAGSQTTLNLQLIGVTALTITAFGQDATPALQGPQLSYSLAIPAGTASGSHDVVVRATGAAGEKTVILKLRVRAAQPVGGKP